MKFIYKCPVCNNKLELVEKSFICDQKHTYDISKEGYVNLLLANQKNSKNPGDSKEMADGRQYFLDKGYYDLLSDEINKIVVNLMAKVDDVAHSHFNILDVGCGTGFYSGKLREALNNTPFEHPAKLWGIDISKPALQKAAKKYSRIQFSVGSNFHLPYFDSSVDFIFSIFSPFDSKELFRVLKPGGHILLIRPGSNHLKELVALIYDEFQLQGTPLDLSAANDVFLIDTFHVNYKIDIRNNEDIINLVNMTPYHWHLNAEKKALLASTPELTTTVDFQLSLFQKKQ